MPWTYGLTGRVIVEGESGYEEARLDFNTRISKFPKGIVYCMNEQDVANAVIWARKNKMPFRVRGGGHSYEAFSLVDGGLVIDVSGLLHLKIDKVGGTARVGAGFRILPLYEALWKQGLTVPSGSCATTGVSGLTLGGGYGYLSRLLGMTCDNLLAVDVVNPWGRIIQVSEENYSDLLWACRGAGDGSFGVITAFTFRVHPIGDVALYTMTWDFTDLQKAVHFWQEWAPHIDVRLTSMLLLHAQNQGEILSRGVFVGLERELRQLLRPLQEAVPPKTISIRSSSWISAARGLAGAPTRHATFKNTSAFVYESFSKEALSILTHQLSNAPGPSNLVMFDAYGGAIGRLPPDATAFVHRKALFMIQYQAYWENEREESSNIRWVEQFRTSMLPFTRGAYRNYSDLLIPDWPTAYFGENIAKLKKVKKIYDPENVFRFEQSIPL
ncbi:FAD-binding oxidoreductase [Brevibacillus centrosporus]|uniref:FAD-binding oxidoreductase n=1 Tax=Brevibacillus centrosporus TaxID=54910 RepID=UPI001141A9C2|nr:FAD-binding oxidoreductase [Brevibacillus centrosporus]MEC2127814.1 FAD-binding oxidoreductase [Brevibacillus centrosporus]GED32054.1 FAD-binding protein [Brevibacillus centrosporus]